MNKRTLMVLGGVLLVFVLGIMAGSGCGSKGRAVQKVLDQVDANVSNDTIDLRSCPPDFQEAFLAWKGIDSPAYIDPNELSEPMGSYRLALQNIRTAEDIERNNVRSKNAGQMKSKAWLKVETVALRYGAQTGMSKEWGWWTTLKGYVGISTNAPAP